LLREAKDFFTFQGIEKLTDKERVAHCPLPNNFTERQGPFQAVTSEIRYNFVDGVETQVVDFEV
jgi:hypothetical protein